MKENSAQELEEMKDTPDNLVFYDLHYGLMNKIDSQ